MCVVVFLQSFKSLYYKTFRKLDFVCSVFSLNQYLVSSSSALPFYIFIYLFIFLAFLPLLDRDSLREKGKQGERGG